MDEGQGTQFTLDGGPEGQRKFRGARRLGGTRTLKRGDKSWSEGDQVSKSLHRKKTQSRN